MISHLPKNNKKHNLPKNCLQQMVGFFPPSSILWLHLSFYQACALDIVRQNHRNWRNAQLTEATTCADFFNWCQAKPALVFMLTHWQMCLASSSELSDVCYLMTKVQAGSSGGRCRTRVPGPGHWLLTSIIHWVREVYALAAVLASSSVHGIFPRASTIILEQKVVLYFNM